MNKTAVCAVLTGGLVLLLLLMGVRVVTAAEVDYERARWDPIHFKPAIDKASDAQCLGCHQEIMERRVLAQSPAGVKSSEVLAWYQTLATYDGPQETFHRRHLVTPYAEQMMDLKCTTCHQGNDPREEAPIWGDASDKDFTLRKMVNPMTCLKCHGQFDNQKMGIPGPWLDNSETFGNSCLTCHANIRTERHKGVDYLKAEAIEEASKKDADACYGCHGGRAWYRIAYPYSKKTAQK